jgi:hypothetical protein
MSRESRMLAGVLLIVIPTVMYGGYQQTVPAQSVGQPLALPVKYDEHRFFVQPIAVDGTVLNFYSDTGGALFIFADVVERLKLASTKGEGGAPDTVTLPKFRTDASIPSPRATHDLLFVRPANGRNPMSQDWSGMLGQQWFAGRVWTFDYPNKKLLLRAGGDIPKHTKDHEVTLGFQTNPSGTRQANFPRIQIIVDGEQLDLLLDTGAMTRLSDNALALLSDKRPSVRTTSFITASTFEKWHARHPQWRVIEHAEFGSDEAMIEVPNLTVGGYTVGPVWFTRRADKNFHEFMSQWMDKTIEGALGGSALQYFRVTVDYPRAIAVFEK